MAKKMNEGGAASSDTKEDKEEQRRCTTYFKLNLMIIHKVIMLVSEY